MLRLTLALLCCFGVLISISTRAYTADDLSPGDTELSADTASTEAPPRVIEEPTDIPVESPTPSRTPTTVPAIPFDPTVDCKRPEGGLAAIAGDPGRGWLN